MAKFIFEGVGLALYRSIRVQQHQWAWKGLSYNTAVLYLIVVRGCAAE